MIIRILTEGQYNFPSAAIDELNEIDNQLVAVLEAEQRPEFDRLLVQMLELVRQKGAPLPVDELVESDLILPEPDITMEEAKELFAGEGMLPG